MTALKKTFKAISDCEAHSEFLLSLPMYYTNPKMFTDIWSGFPCLRINSDNEVALIGHNNSVYNINGFDTNIDIILSINPELPTETENVKVVLVANYCTDFTEIPYDDFDVGRFKKIVYNYVRRLRYQSKKETNNA